MEANNNKPFPKEPVHDFTKDKKWLHFLMGHADSKAVEYRAFIVLIYLMHLYTMSMCLLAMYLVVDMEQAMESFHTFVIAVYSCWGVTVRLRNDGSLKRAREIILSGIYLYGEEDRDIEAVGIKEAAVQQISKRINMLAFILFTTAIYALVFLPLSQMLFLSQVEKTATDEILNPYLPNHIYMPFNSRTYIGYTCGILVNFQYMFYAYGNATCLPQIYISCALQLRAQLQILNRSLRIMEERAYRKYSRNNPSLNNADRYDLYREKDFQDCLFDCLRANMLHHQALLRFQKEIGTYVGSTLLISATLASVDYAASFFLILQNPPVNVMVVHILTLLAEVGYTYFLCYVGQEVLEESTNLHESLYATPWFCCDKRFNQLIDVMLCYTLKPIQMKTLLFDFTASFKTFGDVMSAMYKIVNLVRQ